MSELHRVPSRTPMIPSEAALREAVEDAKRRHPRPPKVKVLRVGVHYHQHFEKEVRRLYKKGWRIVHFATSDAVNAMIAILEKER